MLRILIVDDDEAHRDEYLSHIKSLTFPIEATTADNGVTALKMFERKESRPHVMLLDLMMPNSGIGLLQKLSRSIKKEVYIIVVTNVESPKTEQLALRLGADFYYVKRSAGSSPEEIIAHAIECYKDDHPEHGSTPVTYNVEALVKAEMTLIELPDDKGYNYLVDAIMLNVEEVQQGKARFPVTHIRLMLAAKYKTSDSSVETAMNRIIKKTWMITNPDKLEKHYKGQIDPGRGCPTSKDFVAYYTRVIVDSIRMAGKS